MTPCKVCHAWRPSHWASVGWSDEEAPCIYKEGMFHRDFSCPQGSIVDKRANSSHSKEKFDYARDAAIKAVGGIVNATAQRAPTKADENKPDTRRSSDNKSSKSVVNYTRSDDFADACTPALYEHQQEALEFFKDKAEIALFFEMGVGKSATVLAIAAEKFKRKEIDALLIVAPNDVHKQWAVEQVPLWLGVPYDIQCLYGRGGARTAYAFDEDPEILQVVSVNIDTFSSSSKWRDIVDWANAHKTFIILDEATVIKNVHAQRTQRMLYEFNSTIKKGKTIISSTPKSVARAILTGTPVTNGAMDLWAMMEFLKPNFFGRNWYSFQNYYGMFTKLEINNRVINVPLSADWWSAIKACSTYNEAAAICGCSLDTYNVVQSQDSYKGPYKHADELKEMLQSVSRFKLLVDCADMPPQNYITRELTMSDELRECYDSMREEFIAEYEDHKMTAKSKLVVMLRLQQLSSGFIYDTSSLYNDDDESDEDKVFMSMWNNEDERDVTPDEPIKWIGKSNPKLDALYRDVEEVAKPCIISTRFSAEAKRIFDDLSKNYRCCLITGWKRIGTIEEFKEGKYDIMVANVASMARGHNLQRSHTILSYSNTFSLELRLQLEGRIFRLGQKSPCEYIDYVYKDSVDEKIVTALLLKRNLLDYMRGADIKEIAE